MLNRKGEVVGVGKALITTQRFFEPFNGFMIGETGEAVLINKHGKIIFHNNRDYEGQGLFGAKNLQYALERKTGWLIAGDVRIPGKKIFVAWSEITHPVFREKDIHWRVCIEQDAREVFQPLRQLF